MDSEAIATIAAAACFLVAALACARSEDAGVWLGVAGAAFLAVALVARARSAHSWPLGTSYEFALAFALGTALAAIFIGRRKELLEHTPETPTVRATTMALAAALIVYARLGMPAASHAIRPLPPALSSIWLPLHAGTAALGYGALAMAGLAGLIRLLQDSGDNNTSDSGIDGHDGRWLLHRAVIAGYPLLTLSLLLGVIWSWTAWGQPWSWEPKQVSTLFTWLVYTAYWPLRKQLGRHGRSVDWLALFGLGCLLFTFLGVGWLARWAGLQSRHLF